MLKKLILSTLILITCFCCFAYYHFREQEHLGLSKLALKQIWKAACPKVDSLHTGDLIFRHGRGAISNMLMAFSRREAKYSHAGIISKEGKKVYVYHAIGGEENVSNKLRKDPLEVFCNPNDVHSFGIYRLDLDPILLYKVDSIAQNYFAEGLEFDTKFDLSTDDRMYCSEFVFKVIMQVARNQNYLSLTSVSGMKYVACDDLYLNPHCRFIYSYNY